MNPQDFNPPDLTAYALGELPHDEAARVRQHLDQSPEARAELEQIQVMLTALHQSPPIPVRALHPRQRETVLSMGQAPVVPVAAPSSRSRVVPFRPAQSRVPYARPVAHVGWTLFKYAAAASLTSFFTSAIFASVTVAMGLLLRTGPDSRSGAARRRGPLCCAAT